MDKSVKREWKKVFESDLSYIVYELKELVKNPALVFIEGEVGAGKTTFIKSFIDDELVQSPSYSILMEHKNILHADFYRIEDRDEITALELAQHLENKEYFLAEWGLKYAERIYRETPESYSFYTLDILIRDAVGENSSVSRDFVLSELKLD